MLHPGPGQHSVFDREFQERQSAQKSDRGYDAEHSSDLPH